MTAGEDYMSEIEKNLVEKRQAVDANQGHANIHEFVPINQSWPLTNNSVASLQNPHQMVYGSTQNGHSAIDYQSEHQRASTNPGEAPNVTNNPLYAPATSYVQPSQQEYTGHPTYPSTGSYGYGSSEYQNQYCGYQPPANDPSHQHVGAGPNTGAPYQSLSSFQNEIPYVGPTSYSDTYYNHGDYQTSNYQTSSAYQSNNYNNQSTSWNGGIGGNVPPYEYSNYTSTEATHAHNMPTTAGNPLHYKQQYGQWAGYYGQSTSSNVLCAPGTEKLPVINTKNLGNQTLNTSSGHLYANNQPPPPGTSSWRQDFTPSALPASQGKKDDAGCNQNSGWKAGEHVLQNQHDNQTTSYCQTTLDSNHSVDQPKAFHSQSSNLQFPLTNQVSQNFQTFSQTTTAPDSFQTNNMQIQTNPRIAPNLVLGMQKAVATRDTLKPAYITVAPPKLHNNVVTQDSGDNPKGFLPASLRTYVERTFGRCKDDSQRTVNQDIMKDIITKASADGTLLTRNWDTEPLFPLPKTTLQNSENSNQNSTSFSFSADHGKNPKRRVKSRWEPLPEEKMATHTSSKEVLQDLRKGNKKVGSSVQTFDGKNNSWYKMKFVPAQKQSPNTASPLKRQRFGESNSDENGHASSDSDIEQNLTKYHSSAITLANSPEERKKRENRGRRFEKRQNHKSESTNFKTKSAAASMYSRRTDVQFLAKNYEDNANRAVEDIDWDSLTIKGTCQEIAKHYLRLTSAPDPATVRSVDVLEKALLMVKSSQKNYLYKCDQLKSIRQDLTVQRIQSELTVKVYETHARLALEAGDLSEYNQCQSQLKRLYSEGINGCQLEFYAYNLLHVILHSSNNRELLLSMSRLSGNAKKDVAVRHALAVRAAVTSNNYVVFFRLYKKAPNLNTHLMDLYVEKMRFEAIRCICKSYRPGIPISYICRVLGFSKMDLQEDCMEYEDTNGLEECDDWLRAHGAVLTSDNKGEMQLDTKASSSTLYMPEPEDAVSHGDASLAVGDFMTRTSCV